jgi:hypothetical protein
MLAGNGGRCANVRRQISRNITTDRAVNQQKPRGLAGFRLRQPRGGELHRDERYRQPMEGDADPVEASGFHMRPGLPPDLNTNIFAHLYAPSAGP